MKKLQTVAAYLAVLALVGVSSLKSAEPGQVQGHATVRTVKGTATYAGPDGVSHKLTANTELGPDSVITTGPDTYVYVNINGLSSAVRVASDTTLAIKRMWLTGSSREGTHDTGLDLRVGSIVGQVKKVSADSRYEIVTPHGVAGIRGTDFAVDVVSDGNGQYTVTFTSLTGTVVASAVVNGQIETKTLSGGESWTPGGEVVPVKIDLLEGEINEINEMIGIIGNGGIPPTVPILPIQIRPQPGGGTPS